MKWGFGWCVSQNVFRITLDDLHEALVTLTLELAHVATQKVAMSVFLSRVTSCNGTFIIPHKYPVNIKQMGEFMYQMGEFTYCLVVPKMQ